MGASRLTKHVEDEERRRELLAIESRLVEADFPPQLERLLREHAPA